MTEPATWHLPVDNHTWAFFYFCKRAGDTVKLVKHPDGTATLTVRRKR